MGWLDHFLGRRHDVSKDSMDLNDVRAAPVDPTLEAAARETAERIQAKAKQISILSADISQMSEDLVSQFVTRPRRETAAHE